MSYKWTKEQIASLSKNPHVMGFSKDGSKLFLDRDFLNQVYEVLTVQKNVQAVKTFFQTNGFPCDIMPPEYFHRLTWRLRYKDKKKACTSDTKDISADSNATIKHHPLSQFAGHPFIVKNSGYYHCLSDEFYNEAIRLHQLGFSIEKILGVYGIDASVITDRVLKGILKKLQVWKKTKVSSTLTAEQRCQYARNRVKLLEEGVAGWFAGMKAKIPSMTRQELRDFCRSIEELTTSNAQGYSKKALIEMCGLSGTRYYRVLSDESYIMTEELQNTRDDEDVAKIRQVLEKHSFPLGIRQIYMQLPRVTGVSFSLNKIRRLMRKNNITCQVRRPRNALKAKREWLKEHVRPNLLHRRFRLHRPGEVILSDVTYLTYAHGTRRAYGSSAIDSVTGRLLTFCVSEKNDLALGLDTLARLSEIPGMEQAMFHSDQGILYLSDDFQDRLKEMGMTQSMSKRGNCWDNSPQESFFGHFKDEVSFEDCKSFAELKKLIDNYSEYYNNERCQWTRNRMTPVEYDRYLRAMTDEEFSSYLEKEEGKYRQMQESSSVRAKLRAGTLGPE